MKNRFSGLLVFLLAAALSSCTVNGSFTFNPNGTTPGRGNVSIFLQDAPLPSVVAFHVMITGISGSDGTNTTSLLTESVDVDFARLTGLRTLLDLRSVPMGTYSSITITLANPVVSFLDVTTMPPSINTMTGTLNPSSVTVKLNPALTVPEADLVGLLLDFDLHASLQGCMGGPGSACTIVPNFHVKAIPADAPEAEIDDLRGVVVTVDTANSSFVIQLPNGRQLTVVTDSNTEFEDGDSLSSLDSNTTVEVSGDLDRATLTLHVSEVEVLSHDRFLIGGLVTDVRPPAGSANAVDLFISSELPVIPNLKPATIGTFTFSGNEQFFIRRMRIPLSLFVFNRSGLVPGQEITLGGKLDMTPVDIKRVTLQQQGLAGTWVPGSTMSQGGNQGTFQFNSNGLVGVIFKGPVTVLTADATRFSGALHGLNDLSGTQAIPLRVAGLVLKDPTSGNPVVVARRVEEPEPED